MFRFFKFALLAVVLLVSCNGSEYSELKTLLKEQNSAHQTFINKIDKADSAEKVEKAINDFNESITAIHANLTVYTSGNPEFVKIIGKLTEPPVELAGEIRKSDELASSFYDSLKKISKYVTESGVKKSLQKMEEFITDIDKR